MDVKLTKRAEELLTWHGEELEGLLERMHPSDIGYESVLERANKCWEDLGVTIVEET